jgi:ribosomal protein L11 methyltransferase
MDPGTWMSVTVDFPEEQVDELEALLHGLGAAGLEIRDGQGPILPGVRAPAKGEAIVIAWFEDADAAHAAQSEVAARFPAAKVKAETAPQEDWSQSWKQHVRSVQVGRLWVGPPWLFSSAPGGLERIVIEPKMAFGTGDHPTTSLCLEAVDTYLGAHPGASVLDVGTGTGVLAIAARRLGAGRVVGTDNDPVAVELARENGAQNGTPEVAFSGDALENVAGSFDLVVANILANTLVALAPFIATKVVDRVVLAGVLVPQRDEVESAYLAQGLVSAGAKTVGEWIRIDLRRPRPA